MSMTTTSASCLSATPRATVAPTLPAPPTTVTLRFMSAPSTAPQETTKHETTKKTSCGFRVFGFRVFVSHVVDDGVGELRRFELGRAVHQAREVVGDPLGADRAVHPLHHEIGRLGPAEVAQHHLARE